MRNHLPRTFRSFGRAVVALAFLATLASLCGGDVVLSVAGDQGMIDGAIFLAPTTRIVGNDSNAFLDLRNAPGGGSDDIQSGFNSTACAAGAGTCAAVPAGLIGPDSSTPVNDQEQSKNLPLSAIPILNIDGTLYREFALALNQVGGSSAIDITQLQIAQGSTDSVTDFSNLTTVYTMSSMDVTVEEGIESGTGVDMLVYVPNSLFNASNFVYLFTAMGSSTNPANDGQDRWLTNRSGTPFAVPEPSAFLFFAVAGVLSAGKRRMGKYLTRS